MRRAFVLFLGTIVLGAGLAQAVPTSAEVLDRMSSAENRLSSVRFSFAQSVHFLQMGETAEVKGQGLFAKAGQFRIEKTLPDTQLLISNGKTIWMYSPENRQAWRGSWTQWSRSSILPKGLLPLSNYVDELKKNFNVTVSASNDSDALVRVLAQPKEATLDYRLELWVSTKNWLPTKTVFLSDSARIETLLSGLEENPSLPAHAFRFSAPKGTDIIPLN